jgi:hypothetical protein
MYPLNNRTVNNDKMAALAGLVYFRTACHSAVNVPQN